MKTGSGVRFISSLRVKFAASYMAIIAALLVVMNTYFPAASRDMIFSSKLTFVKSQAAILETALRDIDTLTIDACTLVVSRLDVSGLSHVTITGERGNVLYDSAGGSDGFVEKYASDVLRGFDVYYTSFADDAFLARAFVPITKDGAITGTVFVSERDAEQGAILSGLQRTLMNISAVIAVFSVALVAFILRTLLRRITGILRAIQSVREGEYTYRIEMRGRDELAMLGQEFDSLTGRLRETDDVRRRFVADASHELKTPLASIKLLSDSILQNENIDTDTVREFVADIGDEAERLARTTEKLLSLTRLDGGTDKSRAAEETRVDMRDVAAATLRMLQPLADSEGITLKSELDGGCIILGTKDSLHQIVFNLAENALKYNRPGGSVTVRLNRSETQAILRVEDTGIGVPEDDLPHIFDRFYRVDKARSRAFGGSGLGLSIVRDTVTALHGEISANARSGGGMVFEVRFPIYAPQ
jgi:signal transduction histidine kinase